jgi:hypothetical protein
MCELCEAQDHGENLFGGRFQKLLSWNQEEEGEMTLSSMLCAASTS